MEKKKINFSSFFAEGHYQTQTEMVATSSKDSKMSIGIPKEQSKQENRIAIVPNSVRTLVGYGYEVIIERGAGEKCHFTDLQFSEAGARVVDSNRLVFECNIIIKVSPPTIEEIDLFQVDQIIISPIQIPSLKREFIRKLQEKRVTSIAMEYVKGEDGRFPIVQIMSEIAGKTAMLTAAELLSTSQGGRGVLLGGVSGVPPTKVVILGAGVVGENATRIALDLGASVRIFDNDVSKLMRIQDKIGRPLHTSTINPVYLGYQLLSADVVIGAVHAKSGRTPIFITEEMVQKMKSGSVIMDISIDQGGCIETSSMTTHDNPTFVKHDVTHFCIPNIASKIPRTSSIAVSNILVPIILKIFSVGSVEGMLFESKGIRHGVYTYKGHLTNEYLSRRFDIKYSNLELLLTSSY